METAARQAIGELMTLPARASTKLSLGTFRRTAPDRWSRWVRLRDLVHPVRSTGLTDAEFWQLAKSLRRQTPRLELRARRFDGIAGVMLPTVC